MRSLLICGLLLAAFPTAAQLQVQYAAKALTISGASSNGDVAVYGISHVNYRGHEAITTQTSVERADRGGAFTLQVTQPSFRSIWLIVDLRSGEYLLSNPPGYRPRQLPVPTDGIDRQGRSLGNESPTADIFVARRGVGAWHSRVAQGSPENTDSRKSHVTIGIDHLAPVGSTPAPSPLLAKGDVVMVFNPGFMEFWVTQITAANSPGATDAP
jgi:hypothetical protein